MSLPLRSPEKEFSFTCIWPRVWSSECECSGLCEDRDFSVLSLPPLQSSRGVTGCSESCSPSDSVLSSADVPGGLFCARHLPGVLLMRTDARKSKGAQCVLCYPPVERGLGGAGSGHREGHPGTGTGPPAPLQGGWLS